MIEFIATNWLSVALFIYFGIGGITAVLEITRLVDDGIKTPTWLYVVIVTVSLFFGGLWFIVGLPARSLQGIGWLARWVVENVRRGYNEYKE